VHKHRWVDQHNKIDYFKNLLSLVKSVSLQNMSIPADIKKKVISIFWKNPAPVGQDKNEYRFTEYGNKIYSVAVSSKINSRMKPIVFAGYNLVDSLQKNATILKKLDTFKAVSPYLVNYTNSLLTNEDMDLLQFGIMNLFFEDPDQKVNFDFDFHYDRYQNVCEIEAFDSELVAAGVQSAPIAIKGHNMINRLYRNAVKQGTVDTFTNYILPHLTEISSNKV